MKQVVRFYMSGVEELPDGVPRLTKLLEPVDSHEQRVRHDATPAYVAGGLGVLASGDGNGRPAGPASGRQVANCARMAAIGNNQDVHPLKHRAADYLREVVVAQACPRHVHLARSVHKDEGLVLPIPLLARQALQARPVAGVIEHEIVPLEAPRPDLLDGVRHFANCALPVQHAREVLDTALPRKVFHVPGVQCASQRARGALIIESADEHVD
mmetsp:Transcript_114935/g.245397  ORF Transcript_114935/g.245397 Transcript_114935/m.245397 type:complete len:213 (-) Transcript_114935:146-784(-)